MTYAEWEQSVPEDIKQDSLWRVEAYRLALFAIDIGWSDVTELTKDRRTRSVADQLYRALGSMSANIAEGYSRGTPFTTNTHLVPPEKAEIGTTKAAMF